MKKVILLIRVSTKYQEYGAQTAELIQFVQQDGYTEEDMEIIQDKESATKIPDEERQGLSKMYEAIDNPNNSIEAVYCWEISRISRLPQSLYKVRNELLNRKIDLRTKHENFKLLNENKELDKNNNTILGFYISMCENEILQKVERTRRIKTIKALEGKYTGGIVLYGYQVNENTKEYEINEDDAVIIKRCYELYSTGKYGLNTLYKKMISEGIDIQIHQIQRILTSPEYKGGIRPEYTHIQKKKKGEDRIIHRYNRKYPAVISEELYNKCREVAKNNNTNIDKSKNIYYSHKLIKCSSCGAFLVAAKHTIQYQCPVRYSPLNKKVCNGKDRINVNVIDSILWYYAKKKEASFIINQSEQKIEEYQNTIAELRNNIKFSDKKYEILKENKKKQLRKQIPIDIMNDKAIEDLAIKAITEDKTQIDNDKINYEFEINRLGKLIIDINNSIHIENLPLEWQEFNKNYQADWIEKYQLDNIDDDNIIYDIIHKHIKEVNIKKVIDIFKPDKFTKEITIVYYEGKHDIIYYDGQTRIGLHNIYRISTPHQLFLEKGFIPNEKDPECGDYTPTKVNPPIELKLRYTR